MEVLNILQANGANVNFRNSNDNSALHLAARKGYSDIVKLFIEFGSNVNAVT